MARKAPSRDAELSGAKTFDEKLLELYKDVEKGFTDQRKRSDTHLDNWDLYNCNLNDRQFYSSPNGTAIFAPFVHDAINARKTRFTNQMFPQSGRYVEVTSGEEQIPQATMALLEGYVRKAKLRTQVAPALAKNGDCEGQYSVYVSWKEHKRNTTRREQKADVAVEGVEVPELGTHDDYVSEKEVLGRPEVEVLHDADLLVLPATADSIEDAIEMGGSVTVLRRWTKARIKRAIKDGDVIKDQGERLIKEMSAQTSGTPHRNPSKILADAAGIKAEGGHALVYETWSLVKVQGEELLCRTYFGGEPNILGCKRCPYWCDLVPVISGPLDKVAGVFKGIPPVQAVDSFQLAANDALNMGHDTSVLSALPIVMTDPTKNPRVSSMVLTMGAVWETSPQDTQFAQFPELWNSALDRAGAMRDQIFQTLGVNPSMVPQSTGGPNKKRSQAEIANEQQVDILTTADVVTSQEETIWTPVIQRFAYYDHQFRDKPLTVKVYGEMGLRANMEEVEPLELNERWEFRWFGAEAARNAAQMQQQIAWVNVIKEIPAQLYPDYELNLAPMMVQGTENVFGPRLAPLTFRKKKQTSFDPNLENQALEFGHAVPVSETDDDMEHLKVHMTMADNDPHGTVHEHIAKHVESAQKKMQAQQQQQMLGGQGQPGGGGAGGEAPEAGAQSGPVNGIKGPPGMIHRDQMARAGAPQMPVKH